jgi:hypothetical protein
MMDIRAAARPCWRCLVYLSTAAAGIAAGLAIGLTAHPVPTRIPPGAQVVTVTPVFGESPVPGPRREKLDRAVTVTDPATVAKIAAVIDSLTRVAPGTYNCPADNGAAMQLTFRTSPGGPVIASVTAGYEGCQFVWVTVGGRTLPALDGHTSSGLPIQQRVLTIGGVGWPYPLGY